MAQLELEGLGERTDAGGPFTFDRFAADVGSVVDALGKPVVLVGQSMAAPIVELGPQHVRTRRWVWCW
ncbi:alpha/beta fold hydrolase [Streptomyces sp. NPDC059909]|uniref:alpha/beta fold hydrolase n=1 Tax=Streptomyces sp. NPDC059909 TaxID=3346998 RepID=UPI00366823B5